MPLQNDVANSGLGAFNGKPIINGGITCSLLPNGVQLGKKLESFPFPPVLDPSGLDVRYTNRFTHSIALT